MDELRQARSKHSYEPAGIIFTPNRGFGQLGNLPGDAVIPSAFLNRLLHHGHVFNMGAKATVSRTG